MDRQIVYVGAIPQDVDQLSQSKNSMVALGYALQAIIGAGTVVDGLVCAPASPPSLHVTVSPGSIYSLQNIDATAFGSLNADTTHQIIKQGITSLDIQTFSCPAPVTSGFSVVYLVEAAYEDVDSGSVILPYFNADDPSMAFAGPANSGISQNTVRQGVCNVQVKTGVAATTGTQTTPSPDAGYTGLYAVTVANTATTITSGNIAVVSGAPFISTKLTALAPLASPAFTGAPTAPTPTTGDSSTKVATTAFVQANSGGGIVGDARNLSIVQASSTTATVKADEIFAETALGGVIAKIASLNVTLNIGTTGANAMDNGSPPASGFVYVYAITGPGKTPAVLGQSSATGTGASIYPGSHVPSGYTQSALIGILPTNSSSQFPVFTQIGREMFYQTPINFLTAANGASALTLASVSSIPVGAKTCSGWFQCETATPGGAPAPFVSADSTGTGTQKACGFAGTVTNLQPVINIRNLPILTAQTLYWNSADTTASSVNAAISSYTF